MNIELENTNLNHQFIIYDLIIEFIEIDFLKELMDFFVPIQNRKY